MERVMIAGAAMTPFGKYPDRDLKAMSEEAVREALIDAAIGPADVGMVFFANAVAGMITGQEMIRGQAALRNTGLLGVPLINVENACASATSAFYLAHMAVTSGQVDIALAVGAEKMTHEDRTRAFDALATACDLDEVPDLVRRAGGDLDDRSHSFFMDLYAMTAREYMQTSGASAADLALVAVKNHKHGAANPKAQFRNEVTVEQVLESRLIVDPLTLLMCAAIGDGASAVVVMSEERARRAGRADIEVLASVLASGTAELEPAEPVAVSVARLAYERAGVGPKDLDLVELHDAAAPAELVTYEQLGLCAPGDGPELLRSGETTLGGSIPVNTSGGLLSKGHPIGATGCGQITELVDQLRGRCGDRQVPNARIALAENGGGYIGGDSAAMAVTILGRTS
jgi:acetyl-CoA acetyltransferase